MRYMLDTNICSYILKNRPLSVKTRFDQVRASALAISTVVLAELLLWRSTPSQGHCHSKEIGDFISRLDVIPWDEKRQTIMGPFGQRWRKAAHQSAPWI